MHLLIELKITSFTCADLGDNTVMLTVTDEDNNAATLPATITVEDNVNPTATTQNITVQLDASGNAVITAAQIDNGSNDNCSIVNTSLDITAFTCADLGANTVSLTVVDQSTNSASANATVTVVDSIDPEVVCMSDTAIDSDGSFSLPDYFVSNDITATDNCGVASVVQSPIAGTLLTHGAHTISYIATDTSGNTHNCSFELTVNDTSLSVEEFELENKVKLFPNPASDKIYIEISELFEGSWKLYNQLGQVISTDKLNGLNTEIYLNKLNGGLYFIEIQDDRNTKITKRVIVRD